MFDTASLATFTVATTLLLVTPRTRRAIRRRTQFGAGANGGHGVDGRH